MKAMSRRVLPLLLFVLLIVPQTPIAAQEIAVPGQALKPLDDLLQADGTLDLHAGFNGSLDPRGWRMVSEPGQPPRFLRSHSLGEDMSGPVNPAVAPGDEFWDDRFNVLGVNGYVSAIAVSGNNVYVGGRFNTVGGLFVRNIAKWDSATGAWSALGEGIFGNDVYAIAVSGNNVYVGGSFNAAGGPLASANNIAKWDGNGWSPLGVGVNGAVYALAVSGSDLYVGGEGGITKWNSLTTSWSAVGSSRIGKVYALAASASGIYVGGDFDVALPGDVTAKDIAKWNGSAWSALGSGVTAGPPPGPAPDSIYVRAIAVSGNDVYVGGNFTLAGGVSANRIAKWNGSIWSALGSGVGEPPPEAIHVRAIAVSGSDVYVAGRFGTAGGVSASHIAKWNGSSWSALGSGVGGDVNALAIGADGVYVGGLFSRTGGKFSRSFGLWHGTISNPPNPNDIYWDSRFGPNTLGVGGTVVRAVAVSGSDVYVGGGFTTAGGVSALNIAKWNGSAWSALGTGTNGGVTAIAVSGSDVYVGGGFTTAGGLSSRGIAKWNGSGWSAMASGTNGTVFALAVSGSDVYIGGTFSGVGGVSALNIARWNGSAWSALGTGTIGEVSALAVSGSGLYVGGQFTTAGGVSVNHVAKWNGSAWSALGTGTNNFVYALAVSGSDLYVGGAFTMAGGVSLNHVAKWNGSTWAALGSGTNGTVYALAVNGSDLYVGGLFGTAGGVSANNIARWNGSTWSPLGSGVGNPGVSVDAIAVGTVGVYVGGNFITAGGKPSNRFGLWYAPMITPPSGGISGRVTDPGSNPVPGAPVQVCPATGGLCLWRGVTDSQGIYQATSLPNGQYQVTAYPPSSSYLLHSTIGPLTIANGANLIGKDIQLQAAQILPPDVSITPSTVDSSGVIHVRWKTALQLTTQGCAGGSAGYQIIQNGAVLRSGTMAEGPAGQYIATIAQLYPNHDYVTFRITIQCPGGATQTTAFTVYIDPSGIVRTIGGTPIMSATVTLYTFDDVAGDFIAVPNGDAIMSPANRANPDTTDAEGRFGWDVTAGFYKVRAEKAGCVSPNDFTQPYVETDILTVPPAVTDLDLRLGCGERLFLPLVMR